ncbi:alkaline phosphatase [Paracoccus sp. DMF-8]|uniref:alkaline phosphatase n=1 Tax=Paracoccus sp. DMF-8 TaxID=3019445 RepID=UPI0023E3F92A|nr:alkaline phosphatase [Paracoccus sp. DMF-8]MDF3607605.1 alkaline phosphatase [Paracoccus sp. DMF-8]
MTTIIRSLALGASAIALGTTAMAQDVQQAQDSYFTAARAELQKKLATEPNTGRAKNVVLFVVDGMSVPTMTAARIWKASSAASTSEIECHGLRRPAALYRDVENLHP